MQDVTDTASRVRLVEAPRTKRSLADLMAPRQSGHPIPRFVRDGLGRMTGEGQRFGPPRVTHGHIPGRTRAEKRANVKAAHRSIVLAARGR